MLCQVLAEAIFSMGEVETLGDDLCLQQHVHMVDGESYDINIH